MVLPKDDRTDSFQEERLDLPYWTMNLAICVLVDVSKYPGILTLEFPITLMHLPFWPGCKRILRQLLVLNILEALIWYPWLLRLSFEMLMILVQWTLHTNQNHLLQCHLGVRLCLCISDIEVPAPNSLDDRDPFSALIPCFFDHFYLVSDFRQLPCQYLLQFFSHSFSTAAFASGILNAWGIGINLCTKL